LQNLAFQSGDTRGGGGWRVEEGLKYLFATIVAIKGMFPVRKEVQITVVARSLTRGVGWGCREPAFNSRMKPSAVKAGGTGEAPHFSAG